MHVNAKEFVRASIKPAQNVVEVGSRNLNGSLRDLLPDAQWYGIDIAEGKEVDEVADGATWTPTTSVDLAICCEVFEHTSEWRAILRNMASWLPKGGQLIITAAGPGREPHSAVDGGPLREGEYYQNIDPAELRKVMKEASIDYMTFSRSGDVYSRGLKV